MERLRRPPGGPSAPTAAAPPPAETACVAVATRPQHSSCAKAGSCIGMASEPPCHLLTWRSLLQRECVRCVVGANRPRASHGCGGCR